jgi:hypothetical protein
VGGSLYCRSQLLNEKVNVKRHSLAKEKARSDLKSNEANMPRSGIGDSHPEALPTLALWLSPLLITQSIPSQLAIRFEASLETSKVVMALQFYYAKGNL